MLRDYKILIIDNQPNSEDKLKVIMDFIGEPTIFSTPDNWQSQVSNIDEILAIIFSEQLSESTCDTLLNETEDAAPNTPVLIAGDISRSTTAISAYPHRVIAHLPEPYSYSQFLDALHRCQISLEEPKMVDNPKAYRPIALFRSMVGTSEGIHNVRKLIEQVADTEANVLIFGESGTGKEVAARNIHNQSSRSDGPFVPINCGAIPSELLESELFGHEKGAFTGAISARQGRFELANNGTIFLDEIGDMPLAMQVKLLRVLQERCFERVGSNKSQEVNVRVIAATHRNLDEEIKAGNFREDLFYRLNVFPITMPALRDRIEDLPLLVNELISRIEAQERPAIRAMPTAIEALAQYPWPGNIRELANLIERLAILFPNGIVNHDDLPKRFRCDIPSDMPAQPQAALDVVSATQAVTQLPSQGIDLKEHLIKTELALIQQALEESDWVVARAANYLNMRRTTLVEKMRKYNIIRPEKSTVEDGVRR